MPVEPGRVFVLRVPPGHRPCRRNTPRSAPLRSGHGSRCGPAPPAAAGLISGSGFLMPTRITEIPLAPSARSGLAYARHVQPPPRTATEPGTPTTTWCLWMRSHAELTRTPQPAQPSSAPHAAATDWSGWERWLRGHLNIELENLHRALGVLLATERRKFCDQLERKTNE